VETSAVSPDTGFAAEADDEVTVRTVSFDCTSVVFWVRVISSVVYLLEGAARLEVVDVFLTSAFSVILAEEVVVTFVSDCTLSLVDTLAAVAGAAMRELFTATSVFAATSVLMPLDSTAAGV